METPYVVRSHAASQTHKEQACWTYTHPHSTKSTKAMDTDADQNLSAEAAKNVNNDRHAHLSFRHDPTHGVAMGCGYGASDPEMQAMVTATAEKATSDSADDSSMMIHGLLGTFHSVLYESNDKTKLSTISIAPHSFSVGMFSWFPLVSCEIFCRSHALINFLFVTVSRFATTLVLSSARASTCTTQSLYKL